MGRNGSSHGKGYGMNRGRILGIGVAVTAVGLAGVVMAPAFAEDGGAVEWGECPEDVVGAAQLECASVAVPRDYEKPDGETIEVMISRLASTDAEKRRGVLMLNPGGPGGAGLSQPADMSGLGLPDSVKDSLDLIGMDPRGVGHSTPVSCGFTADQDYRGNVPPYAVDDAAVVKQAKAAKKIADQCAEHDTGGLMKHMTTANTARDMDFIREALGEKKVNFYGASYGSGLGSAYASMFPGNSDRIVIDSNLGGTALDWGAQRRFGQGMEDTFPDFAAWAAKRHDSYGLGESADAVRENYFALAERLDEEPVAEIDGGLFRFNMFFTLYGEGNYAPGAQLWQSLAESDEDAVRRQMEKQPLGLPGVADSVEEPSKGSEPSPYDNGWSSYLAVTCNDVDWPEDVDTYREQVAEDRETYPLFGAAGANVSPCAFWNNDPVEPPVEIVDEGPENVLVLQNQRDPATPHAGGEMVREAFGDRARLVSVDGSGHGVYVYDDNPCALNVTTKYLVDGEFPDADVSCEASKKSGLDLGEDAQRLRDQTLERLGR